MRNIKGIEVKKGHWVFVPRARGGAVEGRVVGTDRIRDGYVSVQTRAGGVHTVKLDDITQTLGPMVVGPDGVVTQNPLVRVKVGSPMQRPRKTKTGGETRAPGARQKARRTKTAKTKVRGVYANPAGRVFCVQEKRGTSWATIADFPVKDRGAADAKKDAMAYARAYAKAHPAHAVRVFE